MDQLTKFFMLKAAATGDKSNIQDRITNPATSMPGAMSKDLRRLGYGVALGKLDDPDNIVALNRVDNQPTTRGVPTGFPHSTIDLYFDDNGYVMPKGSLGKYIGGGVGAAGGLAGAVYLSHLLRKLENPAYKDRPSWMRMAKNMGLAALPIAGSIVGAKLGGNFDTPSGLKTTYVPEYAEGSLGANGIPSINTRLQRFMRDLWTPGRFSLRRNNTNNTAEAEEEETT